MTETDPVAMTDDERDAFLGRSGTGVLSLATDADEPPHAVPVSYGYDPVEETFYFRLAAGSDSDKGALEDRPATFVTYRATDDGWRSVVAGGRLERTTDDSVSTETLDGLERVHLPIVDIFGRPPTEVHFEFVRLVPVRLAGRKESSTAV
jgi:hypothetical protein